MNDLRYFSLLFSILIYSMSKKSFPFIFIEWPYKIDEASWTLSITSYIPFIFLLIVPFLCFVYSIWRFLFLWLYGLATLTYIDGICGRLFSYVDIYIVEEQQQLTQSISCFVVFVETRMAVRAVRPQSRQKIVPAHDASVSLFANG